MHIRAQNEIQLSWMCTPATEPSKTRKTVSVLEVLCYSFVFVAQLMAAMIVSFILGDRGGDLIHIQIRSFNFTRSFCSLYLHNNGVAFPFPCRASPMAFCPYTHKKLFLFTVAISGFSTRIKLYLERSDRASAQYQKPVKRAINSFPRGQSWIMLNFKIERKYWKRKNTTKTTRKIPISILYNIFLLIFLKERPIFLSKKRIKIIWYVCIYWSPV